MGLRINETAPDFTAETTQGTIHFHDWIGDGWAVLFSHPKNFTPVCTTERLGTMAGLAGEFAKRNAKVIGIFRSTRSRATPSGRTTSRLRPDTRSRVSADRRPRSQDRQALRHAAGRRRQDVGRQDAGRQRHRALGVRDRAGQEDQADPDLSDDHRPQLPERSCAPSIRSSSPPSTRWRRRPTGSRARTSSSPPPSPMRTPSSASARTRRCCPICARPSSRRRRSRTSVRAGGRRRSSARRGIGGTHAFPEAVLLGDPDRGRVARIDDAGDRLVRVVCSAQRNAPTASLA